MYNLKIKTGLLLFVVISMFSCSQSSDEFNEIEEVGLRGNSLTTQNNSICQDFDFVDLSSGPQQRCCINMNFTYSFVGGGPPPIPGIVNFTVEYQPRVGSGFGASITFTFQRLVAGSLDDTFIVNSLTETNGSVMGRWRIQAEDCGFTDWVDHFSFL